MALGERLAALALIGVVPESADALRDAGTIRSWSETRRHAVLYLPTLSGRGELDLRFIATMRGKSFTPPSAAYAYYEPEIRMEARPRSIVVRQGSHFEGRNETTRGSSG